MSTTSDHIQLPNDLFVYFSNQRAPVLTALALDAAGSPTCTTIQVIVYLEESLELIRTGRGIIEIIVFEEPGVRQTRLRLDRESLKNLRLIAGELCWQASELALT
jgi:hypothetical protein